MYYVELVWNREFNWSRYGHEHPSLDAAIRNAKDIENSGDGARVKKSRVVDEEGKVCWAYGKKVE